jgi:CNP1-like family
LTRLGVVCALAAAATACAHYDPLTDELDGKPWEIQRTLLPPAPKEGNLIPFYVGPTPFVFLLDRASVSVGPDGVVRYTLIARSSSGGTNVSYEGIRCRSYERRVYAFGRSDGAWSQASNSRWVPIFRLATEPQTALADDFFCTERGPVRTTEDALRALARGNRPR